MLIYNYLSLEDADTVFFFLENGCTSQTLGLEYLKLLFEPYTAKTIRH